MLAQLQLLGPGQWDPVLLKYCAQLDTVDSIPINGIENV